MGECGYTGRAARREMTAREGEKIRALDWTGEGG